MNDNVWNITSYLIPIYYIIICSSYTLLSYFIYLFILTSFNHLILLFNTLLSLNYLHYLNILINIIKWIKKYSHRHWLVQKLNSFSLKNLLHQSNNNTHKNNSFITKNKIICSKNNWNNSNQFIINKKNNLSCTNHLPIPISHPINNKISIWSNSSNYNKTKSYNFKLNSKSYKLNPTKQPSKIQIKISMPLNASNMKTKSFQYKINIKDKLHNLNKKSWNSMQRKSSCKNKKKFKKKNKKTHKRAIG